MLEKNPDTVKIVYKQLPLQMHKMAQPAALASIAAQKQGKFWQMHDALFGAGRLTKESIEAAAVGVGLDMTQYKKDLANPATMQKLRKDMSDAQKAGVGSTPSLYLNGHKVKQRTPEAIQQMVDKELKTKK